MNPQPIRESLGNRQIVIYFSTVATAAVAAYVVPGTTALKVVVNPALALMLYLTFLQVPMPQLKQAFGQGRFLGALLVSNFLIVPLPLGTHPFSSSRSLRGREMVGTRCPAEMAQGAPTVRGSQRLKPRSASSRHRRCRCR